MDIQVSVVMPVYNGEKYLADSIESILNQSYKNFEYIIIDDCSSDKTPEILNSFKEKDTRIRILRNTENRKIAYSLNRGLDEATGKYIFRMDADDISYQDRLQKQIAYMERNPQIGVSGTSLKIMGTNTIIERPVSDNAIRVYFAYGNALGHPTVVFRKSVIDYYKFRYDEKSVPCEDHELWLRMAPSVKFGNIRDVLLDYRWHNNNTSVKHYTRQMELNRIFLEKYLSSLLPEYSQNKIKTLSKMHSLTSGWYSCLDYKLYKKFADDCRLEIKNENDNDNDKSIINNQILYILNNCHEQNDINKKIKRKLRSLTHHE